MDNLQGFRYIDLFAGIGGFHLALDKFGAKCVFASEWDKSAALVYEDNFGLKPHGDITKIEAKDIPAHNILCGGFPCQPFSISGKQHGFNDHRGRLFFEIARIANYHRPELLILENVGRLAAHQGGQTLAAMAEALPGYQVHHKVLHANHYGVPQNRTRLFMVCFREATNYQFPLPNQQATALRQILEEKSDMPVITNPNVTMTRTFIPTGSQLPNKMIQIGYINRGRQGERIYSIDGHACTLTNNGGGIGGKTGLYLVDGMIRKLSPRECARLQGLCRVSTYQGSTMERPLLEPGLDTFIRYNEAISILRKVRHGPAFSTIVSARMPFGLRGNFCNFDESGVDIYARQMIRRVSRDKILAHADWIDQYKVYITKAYGAGEAFPHQIINRPILGLPSSCCTETYLVIGPFTAESEARNVISYIQTRLFRFLVMLLKNSQQAARGVYSFVPLQDFREPWDDVKLYEKYRLTESEIQFVESMVKPMPL